GLRGRLRDRSDAHFRHEAPQWTQLHCRRGQGENGARAGGALRQDQDRRRMPAGVRPVYFVLTPGFLLLDLSGPAEAFMYARRSGAAFELHFAAAAPTLGGALGLSLGPLEPLPERVPADALIVLSGATRPEINYASREARAP